MASRLGLDIIPFLPKSSQAVRYVLRVLSSLYHETDQNQRKFGITVAVGKLQRFSNPFFLSRKDAKIAKKKNGFAQKDYTIFFAGFASLREILCLAS
jgi:hypothetical protein